MNKKFIAALLAFACYGIHANAQAIIVTKSNDNKIVLPANNVKDITTTTDNLAESLDYYTKDEANNQREELLKISAANEMRIEEVKYYTNRLEGEIVALKDEMEKKDMQIVALQAEMAKKDMQIEELTKELKDLRDQLEGLRYQISDIFNIIFSFHQ